MKSKVIIGCFLLMAICIIVNFSASSPQRKKTEKQDDIKSQTRALEQTPTSPQQLLQRSMATPAISANTEEATRIKAREKALVIGKRVANSPNKFEAVSQAWKTLWPATFNDSMLTLFPGKSPSEILQMLATRNAPNIQQLLASKDFVFATDVEQRSAVLALSASFGVLMAAKDSSTDQPLAVRLPKLLEQRQDRLPISVGDALTYIMIDDAATVSSVRTSLADDQLSSWVTLSRAKNPAYRLIALKVFGQFDTTTEQAQQFYSSYLGETEIGINKILAESLAQRSEQWATNVLPQVNAKIPLN